MKRIHLLPILSMLTLLVACATPGPQQVNLQPQLTLSPANIGQGLEIGVSVFDGRDNKTLGQRGGADINSAQKVEDVVRDTVVNGLKTKGFTPIPGAAMKHNLKVEIQRLSYSTFTGVWMAKAELKVTAINDQTEIESVYRVEKESEIVFAPGAEQSEKVLNQTLADVLNKLFEDRDLFALLSR